MTIETRENVKSMLGITSSDDDARIDALLDPLSKAFERYAGLPFEAAEFTEFHFGGEQSLPLRRWPVNSIASVTDLATGVALAATEYEVESRTGLLRRKPHGSQWAVMRREQILPLKEATGSPRWKVVYNAGEAGEDVKLAFAEAIQSLLTGSGGLASEKDGDYAYTRAPGSVSTLPDSARMVLETYRAGGAGHFV